jgi:ribosome-associated protein
MKNNSNSLKFARAAAEAALDKIGEDIVGLDVRGLSSVTDIFVFVSGTSHIHVRALEDAIREKMSEVGATLKRTDGQRGHTWRALDYGDVIVHIMDKPTREFYAIERLWNLAKPLHLVDLPTPAPKKSAPKRKKIVLW